MKAELSRVDAAKIHDRCRVCGSSDPGFLDMGATPLANSYLTDEQLVEEPPLEQSLVAALTKNATLVERVGPYRIYRR